MMHLYTVGQDICTAYTVVVFVCRTSQNVVYVLDRDHGIYIRWYLINRCARKEQSLLFDLYKAFD